MSASFPYTGRRAARRVPFLLPFRSRQISPCPTEGRATRPRPAPFYEKSRSITAPLPCWLFAPVPVFAAFDARIRRRLGVAVDRPASADADGGEAALGDQPPGRCARPCRSAPPTALRSAVHPRRERLHAMSAAIPLTRPAQMKKIPRNVNTPFIFQTPFDLTFPHASVSLRRGGDLLASPAITSRSLQGSEGSSR